MLLKWSVRLDSTGGVLVNIISIHLTDADNCSDAYQCTSMRVRLCIDMRSVNKALPPACSCWQQLVHADQGDDARVLLNDVTLHSLRTTELKCINCRTRMWANAQRNGRPAEYRWHPLFNAAKFGWCPLLECRAVTLSRRETRWKLQGCPKLPDRSQPLVGRSLPYCGDIWRRYCCLTSFFPIVDTCLSCEDIAWQSCTVVCRERLFSDFLRPRFSASRMQHVSDLHPKFALRPHHVWKYGRHPICDHWD